MSETTNTGPYAGWQSAPSSGIGSELVRPDAIHTPDAGSTKLDQPYQALNPCPSCGSKPHDAPDGVHGDGTPRWNFPHCFKCGFRPGTNVATDLAQLQKEFAAFREWQTAQMPAPTEQNGLLPPSGTNV